VARVHHGERALNPWHELQDARATRKDSATDTRGRDALLRILSRMASQTPAVQPRLQYLDTLRLGLTLLVIVHHSLIAYGGAGSWFYVEPNDWERWSVAATVVTVANQFYFMGLFFLVAGYFTPGAFDRKGPRRFLWDRCVRLGLPLALALLFVCPYLELMKSRSLGHATSGYWHELFWRLREGELSPGPLWFVEALLGFSVLYAVGRVAVEPWLPDLRSSPVASAEKAEVGQRQLVLLTLGIAGLSFAIRIFCPIGQEVAHLQLGFFGQYAILFAAGVCGARRDLFTQLPSRLLTTWTPGAIVAFVTLLVFAAMSGGLTPDGARRLTGGLQWRAAIAVTLESIYCVGAIVTLLVLFRDHVHAPAMTGTFAPDAYAVYVIHAPILVTISLAMRFWATSPPVKALIAASAAIIVSFAASHALRRVGVVRRVL
jgi:hypothetical protein